jgi:hypothetical protein
MSEVYYGCGDSLCVVEPPRGGMMTNGGCRCFADINDYKTRTRVRLGVSRLRSERDSLVAENARLRAANTWERMDEPQTQHLRLCTASYVSGIEQRIVYCGLDEGHDGPHRVNETTNGGEDERE